MPSISNKFKMCAIAVGLAVAALAADAQTSPRPTTDDTHRASWIPYTNNGYIGLNVGRSNYGAGCGGFVLRCDDSAVSGHVYLGFDFAGNISDYVRITSLGLKYSC